MLEPSETWNFPNEHVGQRVLVFDEVDSTNSAAVRLGANRADSEGLAVAARFQTAGRGQYGRTWLSPAGSSLLLSALLFPPVEYRRPVVLTAVAAVAICEAVYQLTGIQAGIKWPNDVLIRGKKVCGLLIERHGDAVVVGIGLNLSQTPEDFQALGLPDAVSLAAYSRESIAVQAAAGAVLSRLDREVHRLFAGEQVALEADWKWRVGLLGRQVEIESYDGARNNGRLFEMSFDGLEIELAEGFFRLIPPESVSRLRSL